MKTNIIESFHNRIINLAKKYAEKRCSNFNPERRSRVFKCSFDTYYNIALFLYIKLYKLSANKSDFNFNRIQSNVFKKFSCVQYKSILSDLEKNQIIVINNHYSHINKQYKNPFAKSFLIHKSLINQINDKKYKFKNYIISIELPKIICSILKDAFNAYNEKINSKKSNLNTYYRDSPIEKLFNIKNYYQELDYNENDLNKYCGDDDFLYNKNKMLLNKMEFPAKYIKGRFYHPFHIFSKSFRENVLRFEGEKIKEIFDVSGSDLHMLAKHLESVKSIPYRELIKFQQEVKDDFRTKFGIKQNGKCKSCVKTSFKVYLNMKKEKYSNIRYNSTCFKIDQYFKENYPNIREFIINTDNIWQLAMEREFETISQSMVNYLKSKNDVKSITCHDAIYVKESVNISNIKEIFYDCLNLQIDSDKKFDKLFE
jgi:hypothetical protein